MMTAEMGFAVGNFDVRDAQETGNADHKSSSVCLYAGLACCVL